MSCFSHALHAAAPCHLADSIYKCCPATMPCLALEGSDYSKCCDPKNSECVKRHWRTHPAPCCNSYALQ